MNYLNTLQVQMGIPIWLISTILVWSLIWKLLALWKSARKHQVAWFIILALVNTVGILEILYIYIFSEIKYTKGSRKKSLASSSKNRKRKKPAKKTARKKISKKKKK